MRRSGRIQTVPIDEITVPEEAEISEEILLPKDAVEREIALNELGDIMRALPADSYKLLAARYYNKEDYKTIEAELGISAATARKRVQRILGDMRETVCAKRKKGTTMLVATVAALILSMFFAEDVEAAVVPAGLSSKVAAVEACSEAAAGTGKTAISILTGLSTKKTIVIALIGVLALSGWIASVPGCGETAETETPKPPRKKQHRPRLRRRQRLRSRKRRNRRYPSRPRTRRQRPLRIRIHGSRTQGQSRTRRHRTNRSRRRKPGTSRYR